MTPTFRLALSPDHQSLRLVRDGLSHAVPLESLSIRLWSSRRVSKRIGPMPGKRGLIPKWDDAAWVLLHDDLDEFVETQLDENDRRRHRPI